MAITTARRFFCGKTFFRLLFFLGCLVVITAIVQRFFTAEIFAQNPQWQIDAEVTEVGKNAERARQLLFWVFSHSGIHTAPIIAQLWAISRNIVYVFIVLIIVAFGLGLIISRRRGNLGPLFSGIGSSVFGVNIPNIFIKIVGILLYVTFSYLLLVALIQTSEIIMRFFIENVGGKDLFNVIFLGGGNSEANYTTFVGYKDITLEGLEMARTSLMLIRITSMTYYILSLILLLRTIILWFLLIISPFLAVLMPFVFIRNVGWIWIGVFFQWLFYGPVVSLFLAAITKIWVNGIPYPFDFSRVNKPEGQIYRTAINILYGGPAQTVTSGNTANYVDTYAEYVISLVMIWAAMILPWLLLRIFRDYCCEVIAAGNAALTGIFDRLRQYPIPPTPTSFSPTTSTSGMAVELPFRQKIEEKIKEVHRQKIENITNYSNLNTTEIIKSMDLRVSSLKDVSQMELSDTKRQHVQQILNKISQPERISSHAERDRYTNIRQELKSRAEVGDNIAESVLVASENKKEAIASQISTTSMLRPTLTQIGSSTSGSQTLSLPTVIPISATSFHSVSGSANLTNLSMMSGMSETKVGEIMQAIPTSGHLDEYTIKSVSEKTGVSENKVQEVISFIVGSGKSISNNQITTISQKTGLTESKVQEVIKYIPKNGVINNQTIRNVSEKCNIPENKVLEVVSLVNKISNSFYDSNIADISQKTNVAENKVQEILQALPVSDTVSPSVITDLALKTDVSEEKVQEVIKQATARSTILAPQIVTDISQKTNVAENKVQEILQELPISETVSPTVITDLALKTDVSEEKVQEVIKQASTHKTTSAPSAVSLEDYEEVKTMWFNHYRSAPIPETETIKTRQQWLVEEERNLANISDLLGSSDIKKKQHGMDKVSEILPYMLLGGFSGAELLTYVKAKHEAVKQVNHEIEVEKKAKESFIKEMEGQKEDTFVSIPNTKESQKHTEDTLGQEIKIPDDKKED